jgi:hypothetical protein
MRENRQDFLKLKRRMARANVRGSQSTFYGGLAEASPRSKNGHILPKIKGPAVRQHSRAVIQADLAGFIAR